ncbi:LuxR C-terminal-related transcriptional regulator [uncultured Slackia sp.]|uniref:helix-turn-helix transcriptional regulator n=1 Tax=uncultured Slackia sp. TaxID=665903 RepID=UPI0026DC910B|nr:LuxR C-terminal-related transcriptional regulator [uncultured Slackia sp.]
MQGVFGALETAPLAAAVIAHLGLLCVGLVCGSRFFRRQTANAPLKVESAAYSAQLDVENSNSSQHSPIQPWLLVWIVVFTYGAVFGFYHVIPLGLPTPTSFGVTAPIIRISSNLLGAGLAAALLISSFSSGPLNTSVIWNRFYRLVFPLAVLAGLLIPFTQAQGYLLSITCSETALYYFDMIIALGCIVICKTLHADATSVFAHAFFARSSGFLAGNIAGGIAHETCSLSNELISCVGIIAFTLLFLVTFNTNGEKYAKTVWGILPKEDPKSRFDRKLHERCLQLAKEFQLTEREAQTLELLAQNKRPKEISNDLVLSVATIRTYVQGIYTKLDVHSHDELLKEIEKE